MKQRFFTTCLLAFLVCTPLRAEEAARLDPDTLLAEFARIPTATARFDETRRHAGTQTATQSRGILRYTAPDRLERETEYPQRELSIVNGNWLTLERTVDGKPVRRSLPLDQLPTLNTFFTALRATLGGNRRALEDLFSIALTGDFTAWNMTLKPRADAGSSGVKQIRLNGEAVSIRRIEVDEAGGDTVKTILTPLDQPQQAPEPSASPGKPNPPG
jgi:outer membrane lipoprotein-sorting protein